MSNRSYHTLHTQGVNHIWHDLKILPNGSGTPTIGEGDPNQSYFSIARAGTGAFTLTTKDPFVALVDCIGTVVAGTQACWTFSRGQATKNADNTFSIPFTIYNAGSAADLNAGTGAGTGSVDLIVVMRNSNVQP